MSKVSNSYDRLTQLVICDCIKSSLPSSLARHVLAFEASCVDKGGWLGRQELIDALDAYVAGMNNPPKPVGNVQKVQSHLRINHLWAKVYLKMSTRSPMKIMIKALVQRVSQ